MLVQFHFCQHTHVKSRTVIINVCVPSFTRLRVNIAIVGHLQVLHLHAELKTIVQKTLVNVRAILNYTWLGVYDQYAYPSKEIQTDAFHTIKLTCKMQNYCPNHYF